MLTTLLANHVGWIAAIISGGASTAAFAGGWFPKKAIDGSDSTHHAFHQLIGCPEIASIECLCM